MGTFRRFFWVFGVDEIQQPVEAEEQPSAQLLVDRVVPVAGSGLGHLR